jgi:hypothetical protein
MSPSLENSKAFSRLEVEEGEQGIGYFTTLYLHLLLPLVYEVGWRLLTLLTSDFLVQANQAMLNPEALTRM